MEMKKSFVGDAFIIFLSVSCAHCDLVLDQADELMSNDFG